MPKYKTGELQDREREEICVEGLVEGWRIEEHPDFGEYFHIDLKEAQVIPPVFTLDPPSIRVKTSTRRGSFWALFCASHEKLHVALPEGIVGKRVRYKRATRSFTDRLTGEERVMRGWTLEAIWEQASQGEADAKMEALCRQALALAEGKTRPQHIQACRLDPSISGDAKLMAAIQTGVFYEQYLQSGELTLEDRVYHLKE